MRALSDRARCAAMCVMTGRTHECQPKLGSSEVPVLKPPQTLCSAGPLHNYLDWIARLLIGAAESVPVKVKPAQK